MMTSSSPVRGPPPRTLRTNSVTAPSDTNSRVPITSHPRVMRKKPTKRPLTNPWRIIAEIHSGSHAKLQLTIGATKTAGHPLNLALHASGDAEGIGGQQDTLDPESPYSAKDSQDHAGLLGVGEYRSLRDDPSDIPPGHGIRDDPYRAALDHGDRIRSVRVLLAHPYLLRIGPG